MDENLAKTYTEALEANGVPTQLAKQAATIIAKDDPLKEDLGRTKEDQAVIRKALRSMQASTEE